MKSVIMPKMDLAMDFGTVLKWLKNEGEKVNKDEPIVEVETVKATSDVPSPTSGILQKIIVPEGVEVPVGMVLAIIVEEGDDPAEVNKAIVAAENRFREFEKAKVGEQKVEATKLVEIHVSEKPPALSPAKIKKVMPFTGMRKTIAERMLYSYQNVPQVTLTMEADMTEVLKLRTKLQEKLMLHIPYDAIFVKIAAKALEEFPIINSILEGEQIKVLEEININVAIATDKGLVTPMIRNANQKSLLELPAMVNELVNKTRKGDLSIEEVTGGTFTITNLGMFEVEAFTPIINPGQMAILGIGKISTKPIVTEDKIEIRPITTLSLTFDHRVLDGSTAAQFLQKIKQIIENADKLL